MSKRRRNQPKTRLEAKIIRQEKERKLAEGLKSKYVDAPQVYRPDTRKLSDTELHKKISKKLPPPDYL